MTLADEIFEKTHALAAVDQKLSDFLYGMDREPEWAHAIVDHWTDYYDCSLEVCLAEGRTPADLPQKFFDRVRDMGFMLLHFSVQDPTAKNLRIPRKTLTGVSRSFAVKT